MNTSRWLSMTDHQSGEPKMSDLLWQATDQFTSAPNMLVDGVYETLWKQIVEGERQQGERLSDTDIAAELGVSRTPVRQALHQLQRAGLVQTSPRRGFHVTIFTAEDIRELYDLRTILEVAAVHAAVPRLEEARLRAVLDRDASRAAGTMERHIQTVKEKVLRQFVAPRRTIARSLRPAAVPGGNGTDA